MDHSHAIVRYRDETETTDCPFGQVTRVVTAGEGGVANVHVVRVTRGDAHYHEGYDEVYYVLSGRGRLSVSGVDYELRPGAVAVIPRGEVHSLVAAAGESLEFVIFGVPPVAIGDDSARPRRPASQAGGSSAPGSQP